MPSVLITGASRGIGQAAAKAFAAAGWDLLLVSRSEAALQSLKAELSASGSRVVYRAIDLTDPSVIAPGL
ncbi:MAG: SDR family NAD(P)-dependent oxidoreductase, partial [Synechococcus sp. BS307-5m-G39]|nr:SDR family NAD(P)-dependent oxidoreductase [Synechococcus sp. BS307-5m-G39]